MGHAASVSAIHIESECSMALALSTPVCAARKACSREPLEPKDSCQEHMRQNLLVELKSDDIRPMIRGDIAIKHMLDVTPRLCLLSQIVQ